MKKSKRGCEEKEGRDEKMPKGGKRPTGKMKRGMKKGRS